jgi:hypothetical protein
MLIIIILIIAEIVYKNKNISSNNKRNTIMKVGIMVLQTTTTPQLNNILQSSERCEVAIGVGQRAAHSIIAEQIPAHK